jgi:hypothetical protein
MRHLALLTLYASPAIVLAQQPANDTGWDRVMKLRSGAELRVHESATRKNYHVKLYEAQEDKLLVIKGNDEVFSIPKDRIEKIEYVVPNSQRQIATGAKTTTTTAPNGGPNRTTSGNVTLNSGNAEFVVVYRRPLNEGAEAAKP